jgi:predicted DNA-binding mobile mystery protein A
MARGGNQARRQLDSRIKGLRPLAGTARPHRGWIRAIRDALGMSGAELAARMGVGQRNVSDLERSEQHETIRLETLRRAADALDCDLAYVLLPRTSLDQAVKTQARRKAARHLEQVAHHSRLEDQAVDADDTEAELEELAARLIDRPHLWSEDAPR